MVTKDSRPKMTPYGAPYVSPDGASNKAKAAARNGLRLFGKLTAKHRVSPDYLIVGTKRGGTTSLARWLLEHPQVRPLFPSRETRKGTYYFDVNYPKGEAWYRSHFPTQLAHNARTRLARKPLVVGEATPYYLYHPLAPIRARRVVPAAKIVMLLRNPVERAYSHWVERSRQGVEDLSFEDAIEAEQSRTAGELDKIRSEPGYHSFAHQHYSYVDQSKYYESVKRWKETFPEQNILLLRSEDLYQQPALAYDAVVEFLGLRSYTPKAFAAWNLKPKTTIDPAIEQRLQELLQPDVERLESYLGYSMRWLT